MDQQVRFSELLHPIYSSFSKNILPQVLKIESVSQLSQLQQLLSSVFSMPCQYSLPIRIFIFTRLSLLLGTRLLPL